MFPEIFVLDAEEYHGKLRSGRTNPVMLRCRQSGTNTLVDVVVKLLGNMETKETGSASELLSNFMAFALGLDVPSAVVVNIGREFAESVDSLEPTIKKSIGLNFGTQYISGGYTSWPQHKSLPAALEQRASEILAFDSLIHNPDRKRDNPNLLAKDDEIYLIDHELAFSFLYVLRSADPWKKEAFFSCIQDHVFYVQLKGKELPLDRFVGAFEAIKEADIRGLGEAVPDDWENDRVQRMIDHLLLMRQNSGKFMSEIRRALI